MCSSMLFVVQSTIVTASIVRGSAPRPTTTSLARTRSWAWAATAAMRQSASDRASTLKRCIRSPLVPRRDTATRSGIGSLKDTTRRAASLELVQGQPEARDERLQEVSDFRQAEAVDAPTQGPLGLREFRIARAHLLEALEVGAELVRRRHQLTVLAVPVAGKEEGRVVRSERVGDHRQEPFLRRGLDRMIRTLDLGIELLDGGGKVAREDLAHVVIERQRGGALGAHAAPEHAIADERQGVGDLGDAQAVLLDVLRIRAVHEAPAADELHPGQVRKEMAHRRLPCASPETAMPPRGRGHRV